MRYALPLLVPLSASLCLAQAPVFELESLAPPGAASNDRFGDALEFDGNWLIASAANRNGGLANEGVVAAWPCVGAAVGAPVLISSPMPTQAGRFGKSLALDGDELLVGEQFSSMFGAQTKSAVHRFVDQAGTWTCADSIENPAFGSSGGFANSLARDGEIVAVGAPFDGTVAPGAGKVYVFRITGGNWLLDDTLTGSDSAANDRFGTSVAVSGGRIIVGAPNRINGGAVEGAAYAFELVGGSWTETGRFAVDPMSGDLGFGVSVDVDGTTAVVGAARTNDVGAAYLFEDTGVGWALEERLQPSNLGSFATFGHSVAIEGDQLVVGAYQDDTVGFAKGAGWTFERTAGSWSPNVRLVQDVAVGFHGYSVALDGAGNYAVANPVGSFPGVTPGSGLLCVYDPERPVGTHYCAPVPNMTQRLGGIDALGSQVAADDDMTLVAYALPNSVFGFFLTSRAQGMVNQPGGSLGVLCLGGAIGRYVGPGQIQNSGTVGTFALELDLSITPTPTGLVPVSAGETWNFQAWHRDSLQGVPSSNFTDAVSVTFL